MNKGSNNSKTREENEDNRYTTTTTTTTTTTKTTTTTTTTSSSSSSSCLRKQGQANHTLDLLVGGAEGLPGGALDVVAAWCARHVHKPVSYCTRERLVCQHRHVYHKDDPTHSEGNNTARRLGTTTRTRRKRIIA
jgi:hypothetical protein